jgi:hypothetical protein
MPYQFKFIEDPHISLATFTGRTTQQEVEEAAALSKDALDRCTGVYYMVSDLSQKPTFSFNALKSTSVTDLMKHPHFGWAIVIGLNSLVNFWLELLGHTINLKFKVFRTMDEGLAFIEAARQLEKGQLPAQIPE